MKWLYTLIILIPLLLCSFTSRVQASTPDLPQDEGFLCGDVNEDGLVNVLDIIAMVNYIMGSNPSPFNMDAADINADEGINVLDIIALVNIIMQVPGIPCGCVAPVLYEGQTYNTVQIGNQCWFKENLNVGTKINSTQGGFQQMDNGIIEKYCYENNEANCAIYGGLYEWPEAMQYDTTEGVQGICPAGWHIATDNEWKILEGTVDSQYPVGDPEWDGTGWRGYDAGGNLKEAGTSHWFSPNSGATNSSGFTGLPGGYRSYDNGSFYTLGMYGYFWSSSQYSTDAAWRRGLHFIIAYVSRYDLNKDYGFSVRCLKGCWPQPTQSNAGPDQLNIPGTSTTLAGNTPTYGTGVWHITSGTGGIVADTTSPTSGFTGLAGNTYSLTWTITTQCGSTEDTVAISFVSGFTCGDPLIDTRNWISYNTILIGTQCWMVQNLDIGEPIASNTGGQLQTDNGIIEKYCYDNSPSMCSGYGGLYEWNEAMQYVATEGTQGICPSGWHIPSDGEWSALTDYLGGESVAGGKMKSTGTFEDGTGLWYAPNEGATNESGFTGFPGGVRGYFYGDFYNFYSQGSFWSSSEVFTSKAWNRELDFGWSDVVRAYSFKDYGLSVRCLKDE